MKIKLPQHTPRKAEGSIIIPKVSILTLENIARIYINTNALHVMKEDTLQEIVPRIRIALTRRKETREDIMLMLQSMMNLP